MSVAIFFVININICTKRCFMFIYVYKYLIIYYLMAHLTKSNIDIHLQIRTIIDIINLTNHFLNKKWLHHLHVITRHLSADRPIRLPTIIVHSLVFLWSSALSNFNDIYLYFWNNILNANTMIFLLSSTYLHTYTHIFIHTSQMSIK